jgi:hypothetical protein
MPTLYTKLMTYTDQSKINDASIVDKTFNDVNLVLMANNDAAVSYSV